MTPKPSLIGFAPHGAVAGAGRKAASWKDNRRDGRRLDQGD